MNNVLVLIAALCSLLTAISTLLVAISNHKMGTKTHDIVNSQRTAMQQLLQDKDDALQERGIIIPHDTSLERE